MTFFNAFYSNNFDTWESFFQYEKSTIFPDFLHKKIEKDSIKIEPTQHSGRAITSLKFLESWFSVKKWPLARTDTHGYTYSGFE